MCVSYKYGELHRSEMLIVGSNGACNGGVMVYSEDGQVVVVGPFFFLFFLKIKLAVTVVVAGGLVTVVLIDAILL